MKHSSITSSSSQSSQQVLNRVALAAESFSSAAPTQAPRPFLQPAASDRFPVLSGGSSSGANSSSSLSSSVPASSFRQPQRTTPWSGSSSNRPTPTSVNVRPSSPASNKKAPKISTTLFPELPSSGGLRTNLPQVRGNVSLKNILGNPTGPVGSAWGPSNNLTAESNTVAVKDREEVVEGHTSPVSGDGGNSTATATAQTKGKKGKGKQKQTLFTMGSFPT